MHPRELQVEEKAFSAIVSNLKTLRIDTEGSHFEKVWGFVTYDDLRSDFFLENNPSLESGNVRSLFKMYSGHAVKIRQDLITETLVQVNKMYASLEVVLAVSSSGHSPCKIVSSLGPTLNREIPFKTLLWL